MPRPRKRFLHREVSRHGTVTWYFRRSHGPRIKMTGEFGSSEFNASYLAAFSGAPLDAPVIKVAVERRRGRRTVSPNLAIIPSNLIGAGESPVVYFVRAEKKIKIGVTRNIRR